MGCAFEFYLVNWTLSWADKPFLENLHGKICDGERDKGVPMMKIFSHEFQKLSHFYLQMTWYFLKIESLVFCDLRLLFVSRDILKVYDKSRR